MIVVLAYHSIQTDTYAHSVNPEVFDKQIRWLKRHFEILSLIDLDRLLHHPRRPAKHKRGFASITFDDGFENVLTNGLPVLAKHGVPGTVFFPTSFAGTSVTNTYGIKYTYLDWNQLHAMEKTGFFTIQSHGHDHLVLPEVKDEQTIGTELVRGQEIIRNRLGKTTDFYAYPKGKWDVRSRKVVGRHFRLAFAGDGLIDERSCNPHSLPRVIVTRSMSFWKFKLSLHPWFWKLKNRRSSAS